MALSRSQCPEGAEQDVMVKWVKVKVSHALSIHLSRGVVFSRGKSAPTDISEFWEGVCYFIV